MEPTILLALGLIAALLAALYVSARRATTVAELSFERGTVRIVRGGIAPPVLADLRDVAKSPPIDGLFVRITKSSGRAELTFRGDRSSVQEQRIRNVVGSVPLARLMNAHRR